jgi:hypothetical protein
MEEPVAWILSWLAAWVEVRSRLVLAWLRAGRLTRLVEPDLPLEGRLAAGTWRGGVWDREMDG